MKKIGTPYLLTSFFISNNMISKKQNPQKIFSNNFENFAELCNIMLIDPVNLEFCIMHFLEVD